MSGLKRIGLGFSAATFPLSLVRFDHHRSSDESHRREAAGRERQTGDLARGRHVWIARWRA
jgi:hypothetical protein